MDTEKCVPVSTSSYKDTNPSQGAPSSWPHLNLLICQRLQLQIQLGVRASTNEFEGGGDTNIQSTTGRYHRSLQCSYRTDGRGALGGKSQPTVKMQATTLQRAHLPFEAFSVFCYLTLSLYKQLYGTSFCHPCLVPSLSYFSYIPWPQWHVISIKVVIRWWQQLMLIWPVSCASALHTSYYIIFTINTWSRYDQRPFTNEKTEVQRGSTAYSPG